MPRDCRDWPPGTPGSPSPLSRTVSLFRHGANPYGENHPGEARTGRLQGPGCRGGSGRRGPGRHPGRGIPTSGSNPRPAIAAGAGMSYRELVAARLSGPLALNSMYMPATPRRTASGCALAGQPSGRPRQPWTGEALAPAGGIRASIQDLARLTRALLDGSAPAWSAWTRSRTSPVRQPASALPGSPLMPRGAGSPGTTAAQADSAAGSGWTARQTPGLSCSRRPPPRLTGRVSSCCRNSTAALRLLKGPRRRPGGRRSRRAGAAHPAGAPGRPGR